MTALTNHELRDEVEQAVKDCHIDRRGFHEVAKNQWLDLTTRMASAFTVWDGHRRPADDLHWVGYRLREPHWAFGPAYGPEIMSAVVTEPMVYLLIEDTFDKMWVYETAPDLIQVVLGELWGCDYLVVDKKLTWLMGEDHESVVFACGDKAVTRLRQYVDTNKWERDPHTGEMRVAH